MDITLKDKNGVTLHTAKKHCKEDITVRVDTQEIEITPSVTEQVEEGLFNKVTVQGDANLVPENIKEGVSIFGVNGNMTGGSGDTGGTEDEFEAIFISSIDDSLGANITKLPDGITSIGNYAFYNCTNLALTELPNSITSLGEYAFYKCEKLALTKLPLNLNGTIGKYTFNNCKSLAIEEIPTGVTKIGRLAFGYCDNLKRITILGNKMQFEDQVFYYASTFKELTLPNVTSVPTLGSNVFDYTPIKYKTGYIYVPDDLVNSFKSATNWSTYADQIKGVSELV